MKRFIILLVALVCISSFAFAESSNAAEVDRSIAITTEDLVVKVGRQLRLTTEITKLNENAPAKTTLEWASADEAIAKVNNQGAVTGVAPGKAQVTCQAKDNPEIKASVEVTVIQPVKAVKCETDKILLLLGASEDAAKGKINVLITPENATVQKCSYASGDESVVTVDEEGNLQALTAGKARITIVPIEEGTQVKAFCNVTVGQAVNSITIPNEQTIDKKKTFAIKPVIEPKEAIEKKVEYTSSNGEVAKVNKAGVVTAVSCGKATITCSAIDGSGVTAQCEVTVIQPVTKVSSKERKVVLFEDQQQTWRVSAEPSDATNKTLTYSSSESYVASVDSSGKITAKHAGKTRITATSTDGSKKSTYVDVIVEPAVPISLDSIGYGVYNYNLLGITVTNKCSTQAIVDFDFDLNFYDWGGSKINGGSYSLGKEVRIRAGGKTTIKRTVYGTGQAYKTVITITGVKFADGSYWSIPYGKQETWSFTR